MTRKRLRIVAELVFATVALALVPVFLWWAFTPVVHVVGKVTKVVDDECRVQYTDRAGAVRTYSNYGGKYGCKDQVGDQTDLYYPPADPSNADTMSPFENGFAAFMMLGIAGFIGGSAILDIRGGAWTGRRLDPRPRHHRRGGQHVRDD